MPAQHSSSAVPARAFALTCCAKENYERALRCLTRRCTRRGAVRWPGTKVAYLLASFVASWPVQFAPASAIVSRGTGRAALPLASSGAARVSARSVGRTQHHSTA